MLNVQNKQDTSWKRRKHLRFCFIKPSFGRSRKDQVNKFDKLDVYLAGIRVEYITILLQTDDYAKIHEENAKIFTRTS